MEEEGWENRYVRTRRRKLGGSGGEKLTGRPRKTRPYAQQYQTRTVAQGQKRNIDHLLVCFRTV